MQILYFIGNGFDINLGLKTSYHQFYQHYKTLISSNKNVNKLKSEISDNSEFWSDLELALGEHTKHIKTVDDLDEIIFDLKEELAKYLANEEKKLDSVNFNQNQLNDYLNFPERTLLLTDIEELTESKKKWINHQWDIDIVTFNYTKTMEKVLSDKYKNVQIGVHGKDVAIQLREIIHIHGYIDREMVLGVNDISQIKNPIFHDSQDAIEAIIKTDCNRANKNGIDRKLIAKIKRANFICIFGCSLGSTDVKWWELIGERLKDDCILLIFKRGQDINLQNRNLIGRQERAERKKFLSMTKLTEEEKLEVNSKIFVGVNTRMFSKLIVADKDS